MAGAAGLSIAAQLIMPGVVRLECGRGQAARVIGDEAIRVQIGAGRVCVLSGAGELLCDNGRPVGQSGWAWRMPDEVHYFGLGERTGLLEKKGRRYTFWNTDQYEYQGPETDALYQSIPFYLAVDARGVCHGVLIDSSARSFIDLSDRHGRRLLLEVEDGRMCHYVLAGPSPELVVRRLTELTGRMPLPPRWALGYHHARWGYRSESDIRDVADRLRLEGVPTDGLYFDIDHQDGYRTFTWSPIRFPDPAGLIADLVRAGFKVGVTVNAGVKYQPEGGYEVFDEGERKDFFLREPAPPFSLLLRHVWPGLCAFPDFARDSVRQWWGGWYESLLQLGVSAVVNDMNEPAMHDLPMEDPRGRSVDPPLETQHGPPGAERPHREVHNAYATLEAQAAYSGWRASRPQSRPFVLSRAGSTGIQRYAAVWTGDNTSLWEHLEMSLPQLVNLGLSGVAFAGADIGGFFGNCDPELLVRWYQLGAWYPLARANNAKDSADQEPWVWGSQVLRATRRALRRRYRLLPHWYTLFAECARTGAPMLRPLFYHYPDDARARLRADEALLGRDLLLAPILRPGWTAREVYLPAGRWYGLHDSTVHDGPGSVLTEAPLYGDMPVYARAGTIIAMGPKRDYISEQHPEPVTLCVFPDRGDNAEGLLYQDDGLSASYADGDYSMLRLIFRAGELTTRIVGGSRQPAHTFTVSTWFDQLKDG